MSQPALSDPIDTVSSVWEDTGLTPASARDQGPMEASAAATGFEQRIKALAATAPLHDMDARKAIPLR